MSPDDLRNALERLGLSQLEAARVLHVDGRTVRRWLAGQRDIPAIAIAFLAVLEAVPAAMKHAQQLKD